MAYLDVQISQLPGSGFLAGAVEREINRDFRAGHLRYFDAMERAVILLARRDHVASIRPPGRTARMIAAIFGHAPRARLANRKLEALRVYAVLEWRDASARYPDAGSALEAAGYTSAHLQFLKAWIAAESAGTD